MKKILITICALMMLGLASCTQKELTPVTSLGEEVSVSFTVTLPGQDGATRAYSDGYSARILSYFVYAENDDATFSELPALRGVARFGENSLTAPVSLELVSGKKYSIVFWADAKGLFVDGAPVAENPYSYSIDSKSINVSYGGVAQDESRDAFYAYKEPFVVNGAISEPIFLRRPFAQINIGTNDLEAAKKSGVEPTMSSMRVKGVSTGINLSNGEVSEPLETEIEFTEEEINFSEEFPVEPLTYKYLGMNYVLVGKDKTLIDVAFNCGTPEMTFSQVPVQRNYRTNIYGALLTNPAEFEVTIINDYDGAYKGPDQVLTIEDANEALANGSKNVSVAKAPTANAELIIPKIHEAGNTESVSVTLPAIGDGVTITVKYGNQTDNAPANVNLTMLSSDNMVIDLPNSTVTLNGAGYANVTATTAMNTLVVAENAKVERLTVKAGNVDVYGSVAKVVSKPAGTEIVFHVANAGRLREFAASIGAENTPYNKVVFDADVNFNGEEFAIPSLRNVVFEGQNHRISNFRAAHEQAAGLICNAITVTFRNLVVEGADVQATDDGKGNAYAGVFVGRSYGTMVFDNCQAVNSTVEGVNKVGGIIGFVAENHVEATNTKVVGCTIGNIEVEGESGQIGGFAGYLGNNYNSTDSFVNCSVENTTVNAYMMNESSRTISKFIGCFQGSEATDVVVIDNCTVNNVTLNGMNDMAKAFVSKFGDLLGGQRYANGKVQFKNCPLTYSLAYPAQLYTFAEMANADKGKTYFNNATVKLDADIDLAGNNWVSVNLFSANSNFTFDGQGHTVSNMSAINAVSYGNGFFSNLVSATVRNVTFDRAFVARNENGYSGNIYGIVTGYTYGNVDFENVHVINSVVSGYGKVAGLIGMAADKSGVTSLANCSVENTEVKGAYNCGGFIGLALNPVELNGSTSENVTWTRNPGDEYVELDTTLKDDISVRVQGLYYKYSEWYYGAWADYYIDQNYEDAYIATGGKLADGLCHNK